MAATYKDIPIAGGNTARPRALVRRLSVIQSHLEPKGGVRFLDCGCGAGEYVRALVERLELDAYGVEYDQRVIDKIPADDMLKSRVFQGDLQAINRPSGEWDYAMLNEVLEHVADDGKVMDEVHRILKSNGVLFIFSPNRWFPFETHGVFFKSAAQRTLWIPFIPYVPVNWGKRFYSSWARNYWQRELRKLVTRHGFLIVATDFIWPTFENVSNSQPPFIRLFRGFSEQRAVSWKEPRFCDALAYRRFWFVAKPAALVLPDLFNLIFYARNLLHRPRRKTRFPRHQGLSQAWL